MVILCLGSVSVLLCRVYLGVHSPADVVSGSICGCLILALWMKVDNYLDHYISLGNNGRVSSWIIVFFILYNYFPRMANCIQSKYQSTFSHRTQNFLVPMPFNSHKWNSLYT